jgi:hypothetical protein
MAGRKPGHFVCAVFSRNSGRVLQVASGTEKATIMQRDPHFEPEQRATIGQPDPALQQTRAGPLRKTIYTIGAIVIVGVVLYGMTRPDPQNINASRPAPSTTAQAPDPQPPAQDEATKGPGPSGQPGGQSGDATTGAASQDDKPAQNSQSKPQ